MNICKLGSGDVKTTHSTHGRSEKEARTRLIKERRLSLNEIETIELLEIFGSK